MQLRQTVDSSHNKLKSDSKRYDELEFKLKQSSVDLEDKIDQNNKLTSQLAQFKETLKKKEDELKDKTKQHDELVVKHQEITQNASKSSDDHKKMNDKVKSLEDLVKKFKNDNEALSKQSSDLTQIKVDTEAKLKALESDKQDLVNKHKEYVIQIDESSNAVASKGI